MSSKTSKGHYYNLPLNLGLVQGTFNLFSLLQLTDKIKLTFSKIWHFRCNTCKADDFCLFIGVPDEI